MSLHQEHHFEREICAHLAAHGWLHADGDAALFDRAHGLFMPDLLAWVEATQPQSLQRLAKTHGAALGTVLADRVRKSLNERGTLDVLRRGVEMLGLKEPLMLAQFKPALAINPATQAHYAANRLRVVRQVAHSVGIEVQCAQQSRVRWLIRRFPSGPHSGSHATHVPASPPTIPDSGISPVRF